MACNDCNEINPCSDPCSGSNDCYQDCGCTNPTTAKCTTYTGADLAGIGVVENDNMEDALVKVNTTITDLKADGGKVLADGSDTCIGYLVDKVEAGLNISLSVVGTGCDRKLKIDSSVGGVPVDVNVKISSLDTTSGYLIDKIKSGTFTKVSKFNPSGNEYLKVDVVPSSLISSDDGNILGLGVDGKFKVLASSGSSAYLKEGTGVTITGGGTSVNDPFIISTNPSISAARTCFDGIWRDVTLVSSSNSKVVFVAGKPQYRIRFDGSIEFRGSISYKVTFGAYTTADKKFTITMGNIPYGCISINEQAGVADLKGMMYIDNTQTSGDAITQQYGYIIRKSAQNLVLEFQSSFSNTTEKTIVVNFDGAVSHPTF